MTVSIQGRHLYLWRAVEQDGVVIDILVRKIKIPVSPNDSSPSSLSPGGTPIELTTDRLRSYRVAKREVMFSVLHCQDRYNKQPGAGLPMNTRGVGTPNAGGCSNVRAQRFFSVHAQFHNLFRLGRYLLWTKHYRTLCSRAFCT